VSYFANVAVGTFSRPCLVDPAFQLLVHLPANATAPAPFYNRFEKTYVSVQGWWSDVLRGLAPLPSVKQRLEDVHTRLVSLVRDHLPPGGFVGLDTDTVTSLVLSAVVGLTTAANIGARLTDLVHALEPAGPSDGDVDVVARALVASVVAPTAYSGLKPTGITVAPLASDLIRIATPGAMHAARDTIPGLLREYLCDQEHFDLLGWLQAPWGADAGGAGGARGGVREADADQGTGDLPALLTFNPLEKHVVFTGTSEALLTFAQSAREGDVGAMGPGIAVLDLSASKTRGEVGDRVQDFVLGGDQFPSNLGATTLLVLADMKQVSASVVNSVRYMVDDAEAAARVGHGALLEECVRGAVWDVGRGATPGVTTRAALEQALGQRWADVGNQRVCRRVVVCVHSPPTWAGVRRPYHALFLHKWRFAYFDEFTSQANCTWVRAVERCVGLWGLWGLWGSGPLGPLGLRATVVFRGVVGRWDMGGGSISVAEHACASVFALKQSLFPLIPTLFAQALCPPQFGCAWPVVWGPPTWVESRGPASTPQCFAAYVWACWAAVTSPTGTEASPETTLTSLWSPSTVPCLPSSTPSLSVTGWGPCDAFLLPWVACP
jgi:hypothetical protein